MKGELLKLFVKFLKIGVIGFGGGWAILPIIEKEIVDGTGWITRTEYSNLVAIAGSTPGPVAVNAATYVGYKVGGSVGAALATLAVIIPPFTAISLITHFYLQYLGCRLVTSLINGLKGAVLGLITVALISTCNSVGSSLGWDVKALAIIVAIASVTIASVTLLRVHPAIVILASAALGLALGLFKVW
ncbi:MAG: chromate transporter [Desulfurococcales archaeon ex4484_204]|nr:MAG: chromate transporter [Desulfurococcales archaeon ex4484_204]